MRALVLAVSLLSLTACGGSSSDTKKAGGEGAKAGDPAAAAAGAEAAKAAVELPPPPPEGPPILKLGAAKISEKGAPDKGISLTAEGQVVVMGKAVGTVRADGVLLGGRNEVLMKADAEGKISGPDGQVMPLSLVEGGATMSGGPGGQSIELRFTDEGAVTMKAKDAQGNEIPPSEGKSPPPEMVAEGCSGEMAKTCGLAFTAYMMLVGSSVRGAVAGPAPAPAP